LNNGIQKIAGDVQLMRHPLEFSEKYYHENAQANDMLLLRNSQGLHAPLRLNVEYKVANQIQRLPGLQSSNLMSDILSGRLDTIDFEDILNDPMNAELVGQPHVLMERRLGL
jgi:proteasome maturation protein